MTGQTFRMSDRVKCDGQRLTACRHLLGLLSHPSLYMAEANMGNHAST